jgi:hypothetical protein
MADDEVKCPLCKGHTVITRQDVLNRLESADFRKTIQGYRGVTLNAPEDAGTEQECQLESVLNNHHNPTPDREMARSHLAWGRRSPKE